MGSPTPKDKGDRRSSGADSERGGRPDGDDDLGIKSGEFRRQSGEILKTIRIVAILELDILADDPAVLAQCLRPSLRLLWSLGLYQNADAMNLRSACSRRE
jgi:hypothetical protein